MKKMWPKRINKYLRDKGHGSRRETDELVNKGFVRVNGTVADTGYMIKKGDVVEVKKQNKEYKYFAYYKPRGISTQDLPGKESVITKFKDKGVYPVGRLDKESEGLLILTNDGRFARKVLSKKKEYEKEYTVTVREKINPKVVEIFQSGIKTRTLGKLLPVKTQVTNNNKLKMVLNEGKKHQIRVMLNELSYTVTSLKRTRIGDIKLKGVKPGELKEIKIS